MVTGRPCPVGHFCPTGTTSPDPCPSGTFANTTGGRMLSDCLDCTPGMYCENQQLSQPTGYCSAGYYCSLKAKTSTPSDGITGRNCTPGHYCPVGSSQPKPCDVSFFKLSYKSTTYVITFYKIALYIITLYIITLYKIALYIITLYIIMLYLVGRFSFAQVA